MSNQPPEGPPEGWEARPQGEGSERPTEPQQPMQGPPQGPPRPANWGAIQNPQPPQERPTEPQERPTEPQARRWETYGPPAPRGQDHSAWAAQQAREERREKPPRKPRRKRRLFMWVILAINVLFLWWIIAGVADTGKNCKGLVGQALEDCQTGSAVGSGIAVVFIIFLWAMVDIILGVIYLVTRRRNE
jgi:hypothetical protein